MKNEMWSGRFSDASDELLKEFNASLNVDKLCSMKIYKVL